MSDLCSKPGILGGLSWDLQRGTLINDLEKWGMMKWQCLPMRQNYSGSWNPTVTAKSSGGSAENEFLTIKQEVKFSVNTWQVMAGKGEKKSRVGMEFKQLNELELFISEFPTWEGVLGILIWKYMNSPFQKARRMFGTGIVPRATGTSMGNLCFGSWVCGWSCIP